MKTNHNNKRSQGFTLIEMVGVLAVIAILAALLVPKIFSAINESRLNNAVASINSCKAAAMSHFGKWGRFGKADGEAFDAAELAAGQKFDTILITGNYLEKPFATKVGDATSELQVVAGVATAPDVADASYDFDAATASDIPAGAAVLQVLLKNVALEDAQELSKRIDGDTAVLSPVAGDDKAGRVKFANAASTDVYIYLAHK